MDLRDALTQIAEIRQTVARAETFREATVLRRSRFRASWRCTAAVLQAKLLPDPTQDLIDYMLLWSGAACQRAGHRAIHGDPVLAFLISDDVRTMTLLAVGQFAPCLLAGAFLTYVLYLHASQTLWMLPGLWAILFSLGVFASFRLLPRPIYWVGVYYLVAGVCCLIRAQGDGGVFTLGHGIDVRHRPISRRRHLVLEPGARA